LVQILDDLVDSLVEVWASAGLHKMVEERIEVVRLDGVAVEHIEVVRLVGVVVVRIEAGVNTVVVVDRTKVVVDRTKVVVDRMAMVVVDRTVMIEVENHPGVGTSIWLLLRSLGHRKLEEEVEVDEQARIEEDSDRFVVAGEEELGWDPHY
jgi:hypothetical protein